MARFFDHGDVDASFLSHGGIAAYTSGTHNHCPADGDIVFAQHFADGVQLVGAADEVGQVAGLEDQPGMRDDGLAVAQDGHDACLEGVVGLHQLLHAETGDGGIAVEADEVHCQQAAAEVEEFRGHGVVEEVGDFLCSDTFGTHQLVHTDFAEHVAMLWGKQFGVADSCHGAFGFQTFGQHTAHQVDALVMQDGHKEVAVAYIGIRQHLRRG